MSFLVLYALEISKSLGRHLLTSGLKCLSIKQLKHERREREIYANLLQPMEYALNACDFTQIVLIILESSFVKSASR